MMSIRRKITWVAGACVLIAAIALIGASVYLSGAGLRAQILDRVNQEIAGHLRVEDHSLALLAGQLILSGVTLSDVEGRPIAEVATLRLRIFWPALIRRTVDISSLVIEQARLNLVVDARQRVNLTEALSTAPTPKKERADSGSPWHLKVGDLHLQGGQVVYERPSDGWYVQLSELEVSGSGDLAGRSAGVTLRAEALYVRGPDLEETLRDWVLEIDYKHAAPEPVAVALRIGESVIKIKGRLDQNEEGILLALSSELDIAPAQLRPWLPATLDLSGRLKGNIGLAGALTDPTVSSRLSLGPFSVADIPIAEVVLAARMQRRQVAIEVLDIRSPVGEVNLSGAIDLRPLFPHSFENRTADLDAVPYTFDIQGRQIAPEQIWNVDFPWGGLWGGRIQVQGSGVSGDALQGAGNIELQAQGVKVVAQGRAAEAAVSARVEWAEKSVRIQQGQASSGKHHLQADGLYHWADARFQAQALLQSPHLADLGEVLGIVLPEGQATLQMSGSGSVEKPLVRAVLAGQELSLAPWTFGRLLVEADLGQDGNLHLARMVIENDGSFLEGQGRLQLRRPDGTLRDDPGLDLRFNLDPVELSHFLDDPAGGDVHLKGQLHVGGSVLHPTAELKVASSPVRWAGIGGRAEGRILWEAGRLTIAGLKLTNGRSDLSLKGAMIWQDPQTGQWLTDPRMEASLSSDRFEVQDWVNEITGVLNIRAEVHGPLSDLTGTYRVAGDTLDTGVQRFASVRLEGRLAGNKLHADQISAALAPGQTVAGQGWYDFDRRFKAHISGEGIDLQRIDALQIDPPVEGFVDFDLSAEGTLEQPSLKARVHVRNPRIGHRQWDDFHLRADMLDRQIALAADLNFHMKARYHMDSGAFEVSGIFENTDLGPYLALLAGNQWAGQLSGQIQAAGNRHAPEAVEARVVLTRADLSFKEVNLFHLDHLEARLRQGVLTLPPTRIGLMHTGELVIQADGPIQRDMKFQARGDLPLAALAPFTESIDDATGSIRLQVTAQGPWSRLQWRGEATLMRIGFMLADRDQIIHDVNGTVRISPEQVVLEKVAGMLDTGRFSLDGRLQLSDWRPSQGQLNFKAQTLPIQVPGTMDLLLGADLVLKGDTRRSALEGRVTLLEGSYFKDVDLNIVSSITERRRPVPPRRTWAPPQWLGAIALDVEVDYRHPLLVDNNVARLQVAPDFKIGGTAANPVISGRAGIIEGELLFRRRAFTVTRGVVDFVDPYRIVPYFDIMAKAQIRRWEVTLTAVGSPDNLAVEMNSNPPESDSNILSLIVLGRIPGEAGQGAATTTTEQMLATLIESAWGEQIKERAGVDILEVETGSVNDTDNPERIRVTVGKQLSPRFTVKYSVEATGGETIQRATSEYRFFEHVLASGFQDTAGVYGGELLFRFDFR
jgi:translocation and assembly module TamB